MYWYIILALFSCYGSHRANISGRGSMEEPILLWINADGVYK